MEIAGLYVLAYLLGGVPTAFVLAKLVKGVDIRGYGSGNVGGSNVFYHVGKRWGVFVGVFEILVKGSPAGLHRPIRVGPGALVTPTHGRPVAGGCRPQLVSVP